ncbi:hypothetical protein GCM10022261_17730 [Brevibacterium daeguense]|uniref:Uncharacterized protein n=2 Tax=Brevibacterium daeguense TaxID=909936 RepID=A0ABP8EKA7_9MICO
MALAAINIPAMTRLIEQLTTAKDDIRGDIRGLSRELQDLKLSSAFSDSADRVCEWIDERIPDLQRRLALAEHIERQTPGLQSEVVIDEGMLPTATPQEARRAAGHTAEAIAAYLDNGPASEIPVEVLDHLRQHAGDPYFDAQLAKQVSPEQLAEFVRRLGQGRDLLTPDPFRGAGYGPPGTPTAAEQEALTAFDEQYALIAEYLGRSYGNSSTLTAELAWTQEQHSDWTAQFSPQGYGISDNAQALGWLMTFGSWDPGVVKSTVEHIYATEQHTGDGPRTWQGDGQFTMPGGDRMQDPLAAVLTQAAGNPALAQELFDEQAGREISFGPGPASPGNPNPEDRRYSTEGLLEYLMLRPWPQDEGETLVAALTGAMGPDAPSLEAGQRISNRITEFEAKVQEQIAQAEAEQPSNGSAWVHGLLDAAGLIPGFGEIADGINAGIYVVEGDWANAGLSAAAMIPFFGWGATGAKGIKHLDNLNDARRAIDGIDLAADAAKNLDNVADAFKGLEHVGDAAVDMSSFGKRIDVFDTPTAKVGTHIPTNTPGVEIPVRRPWLDEIGDIDDVDDLLDWADEAGVTTHTKADYGSADHMAADMLKKRNSQGANFDFDTWKADYDTRYLNSKKGYAFEESWWRANEDRFGPEGDPTSNWQNPRPGAQDEGLPVAAGADKTDPARYHSSDKRYFDAVNPETKEAFELKSGQPKADSGQLAKDSALAEQGWDITYVFAQEPTASTKRRLLDAGISYEVTGTTFK